MVRGLNGVQITRSIRDPYDAVVMDLYCGYIGLVHYEKSFDEQKYNRAVIALDSLLFLFGDHYSIFPKIRVQKMVFDSEHMNDLLTDIFTPCNGNNVWIVTRDALVSHLSYK